MSAETIFDAVTAVGTLAAAGAAVWFGAVQPRRRRPALSVGVPATVWAQTAVSQNAVAQLPWLLVPITNDRSRDAAEDAEIIIRKVTSGPDLNTLADRSLIGFVFRWGGVDSSTTLIPPGAARQLALGHLSEDGFLLNIEGQAGDRACWQDPCAQIEVSVAARNTPAVDASFLVRLDLRAPGQLTGELLN